MKDKVLDDSKEEKFLNINDTIRRKTKYWREVILIYAIVQFPVEVITFFEFDTTLGKLRGLGGIIFGALLLISAAWIVALKYIRKKRGEFVE